MSPPSIPVAGLFVFGSISPTTEPNSRAGPRRPGSAPWPAFSTRRCRRCSAPRCSCARPDAPTPACTPPVRWRTSTCLPMRCRTPTRAPRAPARASSCRWCDGSRGSCPPMSGSSTSPARQRVSTPGSRRCGATTTTGCRPRRTASSRSEARYVTAWPRPLDVDAMAAASRELVGLHDFAAFCRHREGATTIRDLQRLDWSRDGRPRHRVRQRRRVLLVDGALVGRRAAGGRGGPPRTRLGAPRLLTVDTAVQRLRGRAAARADAGRRGLPARRPTRGAHRRSPAICGAID